MNRQIAAVIFDCDGTLVDSETPGLDVLHEEIARVGVVMERREMEEEFRGKSMAFCVAAVGGRLTRKPPGFEEGFERQVRVATAARFRQGLAPLPGAVELLRRLRIPYCVASNGPREKMELTLGLSGLRALIGERIFSAYEVGSFKPEPGLFLHAAAAMAVEPERCAVVEDSLPGVIAGVAAGMRVFSLEPQPGLPTEVAGSVRFIAGLADFDRLLHGR